MPELLPGGGAVDICGFIVGGIYGLQLGEDHQVGEGEVFPDIKDNGYPYCGTRGTYQVESLFEDMQHLYGKVHEYAIHRVEEKLPGKDNRYYRRHIGQQDQSSYQPP